MKKTLVGFLILPLIPALLWLPLSLLYQAMTGVGGDTMTFVQTNLSQLSSKEFIDALVKVYIAAFVVGLPLYLFMARSGWLGLWQLSIAGVGVALISTAAYYSYRLLQLGGQGTKGGTLQQKFNAFSSMWQDNLPVIIGFCTASLLAAIALWLFGRSGHDIATINLDDDWEVTEKL